MAQVKLGQLFRRATTTLGEISATQPLETRLYGPSGEVLRTVSLGSGERGLAVVPYASDGGELFSAAKPGQVALTGRTTSFVTITSTPLGAGGGTIGTPATFTSSWFDATTFAQPFQEGLTVRADLAVEVEMQVTDDQTRPEVLYRLVIPPDSTSPRLNSISIPAVEIPARHWRYVIRNYATVAMTKLVVTAVRNHRESNAAQTIAPILANQIEIRDTEQHAGTLTNDIRMYVADLTAWGNAPKGVIFENTLNQAIDVALRVRSDWTGAAGSVAQTQATLGSVNIAAGGRVIVTNQDFPGLDIGMKEFYLLAQCSVAPTSGSFSARMMVDANY